jgi:hypothetical protein
LLNANSIGWLPTKAHFADVKEAAKNNWKEGMLIVEEWLLIEYAVGRIPVNSETVVEAITSLDWDLPKTEFGSQDCLSAVWRPPTKKGSQTGGELKGDGIAQRLLSLRS